jgi:diguanylate cyclase (GGDEF)-like protein/PAS domain S-box-containing protein
VNTYQLAARIIRLGSGEEPEATTGEASLDTPEHTVRKEAIAPPTVQMSDAQLTSQSTATPSTSSGNKMLHSKNVHSRLILDCIGDAVASSDAEGKINYLNMRAQHLTGWPINDALGRYVPEVLKILDAETREVVPDYLDKAVRADRTLYLPKNCIMVRRDGSEFPIEDSVAPIHNEKGQTLGAVLVFRDVSAAEALKREIMRSAEYDYLTGLPNRLLLNDRVTQAISMALRHTKRIAILFMDLNGFKKINDSRGHAVGDKLLQSIAQRLLNCVRASDTVSRHGGDEFVVLLSEIENSNGALTTAKKLLDAVAVPHLIDDEYLRVTASIGVSVYPEHGLDAFTLFYNADVAMYEAKEHHAGPGYHLYNRALRSSVRRTEHRS